MFQTAPKHEAKPTDRLLEAAGFKCIARLEGYEAAWERGGKRYAESDAWALLNTEAMRIIP